MKSSKIIVKTKPGVHLRVAGKIIEQSRQSQSRVVFRKGDKNADGRSIIELLMLDAPEGSELEIVAEGADEEKVVAELDKILLIAQE
jgi:phosphotransferase system HPr (HPr) family protein